MGVEMAREALARGARVILVAGPLAVDPPAKAEVVRVETAAEMEGEVMARYPGADVVVMAAAVADVTVERAAGQKIKKEKLPGTLKLVRTKDILKELGARKKKQVLVGFAAETEDLRVHARKKLRDKRLDLIVANDVSRPGIGFDADDNQVVLLDALGGADVTEKMSKRELSRVIWDRIEANLGKK
jgi:phosphopantothenoylcysteine decarboxylase/phosphopantothenate--cysteine ligase